MVDPLVTIGIDLLYKPLTYILWHAKVQLCPFNGQVLLLLAGDKPEVDRRKVRGKHFFYKVAI